MMMKKRIMHMKPVETKEPVPAEVELEPAQRGEDVKGADGEPVGTAAKPGGDVNVDIVLAPAPISDVDSGTVEIGLTDATRTVVAPLVESVLRARRAAEIAEERLSDAATTIAACMGFAFAQGTRFEFCKGDDGKFSSVVWFTKS